MGEKLSILIGRRVQNTYRQECLTPIVKNVVHLYARVFNIFGQGCSTPFYILISHVLLDIRRRDGWSSTVYPAGLLSVVQVEYYR